MENKWINDFETVGLDEANQIDQQDIEARDKKQFATGDTGPSFKELFEKGDDGLSGIKEGEVVQGKVITVMNDYVTVDIGYKSEGLVPIAEFRNIRNEVSVVPGDTISVYLECVENESGHMILSKDKAEVMLAWDTIAHACEKDEIISGTVLSKIKGGLSVDIGVKAFLPGSQIDIRPVRNLDKYVGKKLNFKVIKFNKQRGNIVLSRKTLLLKEHEKLREETLGQLQEGQVVQGVVKNITDYGAFVDLGGMDGLLHITDMSWGRIKHPTEIFSVGDEITVRILKYDKERERVSLGIKQVQDNPWDKVGEVYQIGDKVKGKVISVKDYGVFVELQDGIEGLIHVSEMSWTNRVKHPSKMLNTDENEELECQVLDVDVKNHRISLGLKQLTVNPWDLLEQKFPVGSTVEGTVKNVTDFGAFVDIDEKIDGLVHVSDLSWTKKVNHPSEMLEKGQKIQALVLSIDKETEKFSLGIKQLEHDPWEGVKDRYKMGQVIEGKITRTNNHGAFLEIETRLEGFIHISETGSPEKVDKITDVLNVGDVTKAQITTIDPKERKINLSVKAYKEMKERADIETYMGEKKTTTSTLGKLFGGKLKLKTKPAAKKEPAEKAPAKKAAEEETPATDTKED